MAYFGFSGVGGLTLLTLFVVVNATPASGPNRRLLQEALATDPLLEINAEAQSNSQDNADPEFDPEKVSLNVPDELFAPAFNSINSISSIIGNVIQNTAERLARFIEQLKPLLRTSLGFRPARREPDEIVDEIQDTQATQNTQDDELDSSDSKSDSQKSTLKSSYTALVHKR